MENKPYYSPKEIFNQRAKSVAEAQKNNSPIYTPDNYSVEVVADRDLEWELSHSQLIHKDEYVNPPVSITDELTSATYYATRNQITPYRAMPEASKNSIYIYLSTADPERLGDPQLQEAIFTRVAEIQKQDMIKAVVDHQDPSEVAQANADEISSISSFLGSMKEAVKVEGNYFAAGYTPTEVQ